MRRMTVGAILAVLTASSALALPSELPGEPTPSEAKALIAQLGADDYRKREKAGQALFALGERALPALKTALKTLTDPEAHRRAEVLVQRIETKRLTTARRVTLKVANQSPEKVVAEIAKQSGYAIQYNAGGQNQKLTLDLRDVPFWEALDQVCGEAGLSVYQNNNETGELVLSYSDSYDPHVSFAGPFRMVASHLSSSRNIQLSGLPRRQPNPRQPEYLNLNFNLYAEPKAPVLGLGQAVLTKALDDTGASMLLQNQQAEQSISYYPQSGGYRSFHQSFGVSLNRVSQKATTIKELRGKVPVVILSEVRPEIAVEDLLKSKKKKFTGRTMDLEIESAEFANDVLALNLTIRRRQGDPNDFTWTSVLPQRLEVTDAAGGKFSFNGIHNQTTGPNVATYQLQFATNGKKLGKPAKLQLVEWITVTRDVEFTFKDIPLP